jgi:hypothetical protein
VKGVLPYWPKLGTLCLLEMVPSASLFAAFGRHNHELCQVELKPVESAAFTAPLSEGWHLMKVEDGEWEASPVT